MNRTEKRKKKLDFTASFHVLKTGNLNLKSSKDEISKSVYRDVSLLTFIQSVTSLSDFFEKSLFFLKVKKVL